jgi:hypothetical protein
VACRGRPQKQTNNLYITPEENMVTSREVQGDLKSMFPDSKWLTHVEVWLPNL